MPAGRGGATPWPWRAIPWRAPAMPQASRSSGLLLTAGEAGLNIVASETATVYRREGLGSDDVTLAPQGQC